MLKFVVLPLGKMAAVAIVSVFAAVLAGNPLCSVGAIAANLFLDCHFHDFSEIAGLPLVRAVHGAIFGVVFIFGSVHLLRADDC